MIPLGVLASARVAPSGGGWTPASLPGIDLWLDASAVTGIADGGTLSTWTDLSGAGNHAVAAGAPTWRTNELNGNPVVYLTDGGEYSTPAPAGAAAHTLLAVCRFPLAGGTPTLVGSTASGGLQVRRSSGTGPMQIVRSGVGVVGTGGTAVPEGTWGRVTAQISAAGWSLRLYGAADGSGTVTTTTSGSGLLRIGLSTSANPVHVAELIHCNAVLSLADIQQAEAYLLAKWGLWP